MSHVESISQNMYFDAEAEVLIQMKKKILDCI
jgi:hypothetical protein